MWDEATRQSGADVAWRIDNNNIRSKHGRSRKRSAAAAEWVGHLNSTHHVGRGLFSPFFLFHFVSCADPVATVLPVPTKVSKSYICAGRRVIHFWG